MSKAAKHCGEGCPRRSSVDESLHRSSLGTRRTLTARWGGFGDLVRNLASISKRTLIARSAHADRTLRPPTHRWQGGHELTPRLRAEALVSETVPRIAGLP